MLERPTYTVESSERVEILVGFDTFSKEAHTARNILVRVRRCLSKVGVSLKDIVKFVLDSAANGRLALKLAGLEPRWCVPHDIGCVMAYVESEVGQYVEYSKLSARATAMSACRPRPRPSSRGYR